MTNVRIIAIIVGLSLLLLSGGIFLASKAPRPAQVTASSAAKAEVSETSFDWGTLNLKGGVAEKTFLIRNVGNGVLELGNVSTSCMCTVAKVIIGNSESPYFGMHSSSAWLGQVQPNQEAKLTVKFDPAYHGPSGIGQISRLVSLETNDQNHPKLEFNLTANVVNN